MYRTLHQDLWASTLLNQSPPEGIVNLRGQWQSIRSESMCMKEKARVPFLVSGHGQGEGRTLKGASMDHSNRLKVKESTRGGGEIRFSFRTHRLGESDHLRSQDSVHISELGNILASFLGENRNSFHDDNYSQLSVLAQLHLIINIMTKNAQISSRPLYEKPELQRSCNHN